MIISSSEQYKKQESQSQQFIILWITIEKTFILCANSFIFWQNDLKEWKHLLINGTIIQKLMFSSKDIMQIMDTTKVWSYDYDTFFSCTKRQYSMKSRYAPSSSTIELFFNISTIELSAAMTIITALFRLSINKRTVCTCENTREKA
jgi:hypothetical protein